MSKAEPDESFWKSLGGILTGIAAIMTAVGGLIGVWYQWVDPAVDKAKTPLVPPETETHPPNPGPGRTDDPGRGLPPIVDTSPVISTETVPEAVQERVGAIANHASGIEKGDAVLAEWKGDGCLYPGDVRDIKGGQYHIYFAFDQEVWIGPEGLVKPVIPTASDVTPGARVYAEVDDFRTRWIPSTVRDVREGRYYVVFDEDARCQPLDKEHAWVGIDAIVVLD